MFRIALLITVVWLASCSDDPANFVTDRDPDASATYTVEFISDWNRVDFPTSFPGNPHFSGLIGATHSNQVKFWESGQLASTGIEVMAETGNKQALFSEVEFAKAEGTAEFLLSGGGISPSPGTIELEFDVNETFSLVTLVSMQAPSPDWFVGVRDLNLFDDVVGDWKDGVTVNLLLYDAGTDNGVRFTSSNADTAPPDIISPLSSAPADTDFVNGVHSASGKYLGRMVFSRVK